MKEKKFGADLLMDGARLGGHIIISDDTFVWKPIKVFELTSNVGATAIPLSELEGYVKEGTTLYIGVKGIPNHLAFYTWKGKTIIEAIKNRNQSFRMYATNEYYKPSRSSGISISTLLIYLVIILAIILYIWLT